jgi:uncharacterized protein (TIGR00299 family) protein
MKSLYFDLVGGLSGDMIVASLLDLGADLSRLKRELRKINVIGYSLKKSSVRRGHAKAVKFDVDLALKKNYSYAQIKKLIKASALSSGVRDNILKIYETLAHAEACVHGHQHEDIRFEQLGDIDSIIDIASACILLNSLGISKVSYGALPLNNQLAPATWELLKEKEVYFTGRVFENVTPTGMAILAALGVQQGSGFSGPFVAGRSGYGAGRVNPPDFSNVLRAVIIKDDSLDTDGVLVIETNIDDMNPQFFEYVFDKLFDAGALDVFLRDVVMKKTRPGFLLTVLSKEEDLGKITALILAETTSLGVRYYPARRLKLKRALSTLFCLGMKVRVKRIEGLDGSRDFMPEYEDCKILAKKTNKPIAKIYNQVKQKAESLWRSQD